MASNMILGKKEVFAFFVVVAKLRIQDVFHPYFVECSNYFEVKRYIVHLSVRHKIGV